LNFLGVIPAKLAIANASRNPGEEEGLDFALRHRSGHAFAGM